MIAFPLVDRLMQNSERRSAAMAEEWTQADQDALDDVVRVRKEASTEMQIARRKGRWIAAWILDRMATLCLKAERLGNNVKRGW